MMKHLLILSLNLGLLLSCQTPKQTTPSRPEIDALFEAYDKEDSPGFVLAIMQDGEITYQKGYGMANLDYGIPLSPSSVFRIASVSKQVTAACIQLLALDGKLSLDDDVRDYFPKLPDYGHTVTIRHMIHHTSGIRDYVGLFYMAGFSDDDHYSDEELIEMVFRQKELNFPPGEDYLYCNSGYFLLGQIVEKITGQNLREFAQERIFQPLGMENTHFHNNHKEVVANRATGYSPTKEGYDISVTTLDMIGDGGVFTTVQDFAKWANNYEQLSVGGEDFLTAMETRGILNSGDTLTYASGIDVDTYRGLKTLSHGGAWVGYRTFFLRFPEENTNIILFANRSDVWPGGFGWKVADILLADKMTAKEPEPERGDDQEEKERITAPYLKGLEGQYYSEELDAYYTISWEEDTYQFHLPRLQTGPIHADENGRMSIWNWITLDPVFEGGTLSGIKMGADRVKNIYLRKL